MALTDVCLRLSRQQMKWEEFVILNLVITSMLSRLWVIFRGVLVSLSTLYQPLLNLHSEVARAQHMPFLKDFTLPADITEFLGPSGAVFLTKKSANIPHASDNKEKQTRRKKPSVKVKNQQKTKKLKEDFGVAVERGSVHDTDLKPFLKVFRNFTQGKSFREETNRTDKKKKFNKQVREASSFTDMATHLDEMITWCKSHKMEKEKRFLTFLRLKCQRMKCLEAAGYKFQRKLNTFRQEAHWALSPQGSVPRTCLSSAALRTNARQRTCFHSIRSRFKSSALRAGVKEKRLKREKKRTELPRNKTTYEATSQATNRDNHDDIDDIFASIGL